jgi:hypothetical protein
MPKGKLGHHTGEATGHNNPRKTTPDTTGSSKRRSKNYGHDEHAGEHEHSGVQAQDAKVHPMQEGLSELPHKADSRALEQEGEKRSGGDSNARKHRKGSRLHEDHHNQNSPLPLRAMEADVAEDLTANNLAGMNHGMEGQHPEWEGRSGASIKDLHTRLAGLTNDQLKQLIILPEGSRLKQGAKYLDLEHLDQGEFVATAGMSVEPGQRLIAKHDTDYLLWDRLAGVAEDGTSLSE